MYSRAFQHAGETRRFTISGAGILGWIVKEERDSQVVRNVLYDDWHRVERARATFAIEARNLERAGWKETAA